LQVGKPIYLLLYSGGVDSILCLIKLVEQGITPFLFHFRTKKLTKTHEKMVKKTARLISPDSPLYVYETKTVGFRAVTPDLMNYEVCLEDPDGEGKTMKPLDHANYVVIGYTKYVYTKIRPLLKAKMIQQRFIKSCKEFNLPFIFPLADYTRKQTDKEFSQLPLEIRENTVSTTRYYEGDWKIAKGESGK